VTVAAEADFFVSKCPMQAKHRIFLPGKVKTNAMKTLMAKNSEMRDGFWQQK
jgi:hypothetical protein